MSKINPIAALLTLLILLTVSHAQPFEDGVVVGTLVNAVDEASGIIQSHKYPDVFYTHNDSGGGPYVYAVRRDGTLIAKMRLRKANGTDASNNDIEDISLGIDPVSGVPHVFVGNFGDNAQARGTYDLHRFPEPNLNLNGSATFNVTVETYNFQYPDGSHDCESLFIDPDTAEVYFLTKRDAKSGIYSASWPMSTVGVNTLTYHGDMTMNWLTAADINTCGEQIVARQHNVLYYWERDPATETIADVLETAPTLIPYEQNESKGESICFDRVLGGYYTTTENAPADITFYESQNLPCWGASGGNGANGGNGGNGGIPPGGLEPMDDLLIVEREFMQYTPIYDDLGNGAPIFSVSGEPSGLIIDSATGEITWTPNEFHGGQTFTITIIVRETGSTNETREDLSIQVLEDDIAPILAPISDVAIHLGQSESFNVLATDADLPQQVLTYTLSGAPMGATIDPTTGVFSFAPTAGHVGQGYNVTVTVTDPTGLSDSEAFNLRIGQRFGLSCEESDDDVIIRFNTLVGETYDLQICDDLVGDSWSTLQLVSASTSVSSVVDPNLQNLTRCFFRIVHTH